MDQAHADRVARRIEDQLADAAAQLATDPDPARQDEHQARMFRAKAALDRLERARAAG